MKSVKVLSLFFALFLINATTTTAQSAANNLTDEQKEKLQQNLEEYAVALDLSEEQKPEFEDVTKKYMEQMIEVKDSGGSRMSKYKKVKSIRKNKDAEMEELLSKDQYKVYLNKQKEMQAKMKENRNNN
ncbi:MAG: hypothetical protein AAFZ15_15705 [Bacteroidota bacterium]